MNGKPGHGTSKVDAVIHKHIYDRFKAFPAAEERYSRASASVAVLDIPLDIMT
jgi:hypothetical protein